MNYCVSCGLEIGNNQGSSCSMCYGDINWGDDNYYLDLALQQQREDIEDKE